MKKLVLVVGLVAGSLTAFATPNVFPMNPYAVQLSTQEEYTEIKVADLPTAISDAFTKEFPEGSIDKAFVNAEKVYKLNVTTAEGSKTLYANEKGEWVQP